MVVLTYVGIDSVCSRPTCLEAAMTDEKYPPERPNMAHRGPVKPEEKVAESKAKLTPASVEQLKRDLDRNQRSKAPH